MKSLSRMSFTINSSSSLILSFVFGIFIFIYTVFVGFYRYLNC